MKAHILLLGTALLTVIHPTIAHEYWLDPIDSSVARNESAIVDVRNGQNFAGSAFPFNDINFASVIVSGEQNSQRYSGRLGDYPALHPKFNNNGLHSINLETTASKLTYESWMQFIEFLEYHALSSISERHLERNLSTTAVTERFYRSAKTIIQVSDTGTLSLADSKAIDVDNHNAFAPSGAFFEMLLLDNPYSRTDSMRIKLLFDSQPLAGRQAEMFWKGDTLLRFTAVTDDLGIATFKPLGEGDYLLNAVQVSEPEDDKVHWLSYWASVTFER